MDKSLFTPGPTEVPPEVIEAMARPLIHHRTPEFIEAFSEARRLLKWLFQTKEDVLILASSGTGAMEGVVVNLFSRGDKVLVVDGGKFGERWCEICGAYGVDVHRIEVEWGEGVDPTQVASALDSEGRIKGVLMQACETSTGVAHDVRSVAQLVRGKGDALVVVDAISALGVYDLPVDSWGLDAVIASSQKGLMVPPGLSFAHFSDRALKAAEISNLPKYYFDIKKELKSQREGDPRFTPAIPLVMALAVSLRMMKREGLSAIFKRHETLARALRRAVGALGLELFAKTSPSPSLTAIVAPAAIGADKIVRRMASDHGITIAGGQGKSKGKIFRIATMGYYGEDDVLNVVEALEEVLEKLGHSVVRGLGVEKAKAEFNAI